MSIQELFSRLANSQSLAYTHETYMKLSKAQQDELKDVGAYIAGTLQGGRRKAGSIITRCAAVLDADNLPPGGTEAFIQAVAALDLCYCIHSTAKHSPATPRLRVIIPFASDIEADKYSPIVRRLCQIIQPEMSWFDPTTDEPGRIMYWAAHCIDVEPVYHWGEGRGLLAAEAFLQQLTEWKEVSSWPRFPREQTPAKRAAKQEDPESKKGIVGAFCRTYDIPAAMDKFLPGVYEVTTQADRFTFTGGSTSGGAVLYEGGKFLFSHHATDPAGGKLVNAFDLVRLHRFDHLDADAVAGTVANRLPSYAAMCQLAQTDEGAANELAREQYLSANAAFAPMEYPNSAEDYTWMKALSRNSNDRIDNTSANIALALENDPRLKGRIYKDSFADRLYGVAPLPWGNRHQETGAFGWCDSDDDGLAIYLEGLLKFRAPSVLKSVFNDYLARHSVNPVQDYFNGLRWDGVPRLDALFIDYLGAEDIPYTRAVTRKAFTAAVARAMQPGIKFDTMIILRGPQGIGKSTLLDIMGGPWFCDNIRTFEGKEASELLQGKLLIEVPELQGFSKADNDRIKQFMTLRDDYYRAAYGRRPESHPRRCVFFGTTNYQTFLRDTTGGRRFWPVSCPGTEATKSVFVDLPKERDMLWAEAVMYWRLAEPLYLPQELEAVARKLQEGARETNSWEGLVLDFIEKPVPVDWNTWDLSRRRTFWNGGVVGELELVPREKVCVLEIWCELLERDKASLQTNDSRTINGILESMEGWERTQDRPYFGVWGRQRGFQRIRDNPG